MLEKLPNKWCVKVTDTNRIVLMKWRASNDYGNQLPIDGYCHSNDGIWNSRAYDDYIEISFEDFQRLFLNEHPLTTLDYEIY